MNRPEKGALAAVVSKVTTSGPPTTQTGLSLADLAPGELDSLASAADEHLADRIDSESRGALVGLAPTEETGKRAWWRDRDVVGVFIVAVLALGSANVLDTYYLSLTTQAGVYTIVALGLVAVLGFGGMSMLGQIAFFGLGAYAVAAATVQWGWSPLAAFALSVPVSAVAALVVGWPTLRLHGPYFAVVTFAVSLVFSSFVSSSDTFNGQQGLGPVPKFSVGDWAVASWKARHLLVWVVAILAMIGVHSISRHRFGRSVAALAHDDGLAESIGVSPPRVRLALLVVAGLLGGIGGALFAFTNGYVSPASFSFQTTVTVFAILYVGGVRSVAGVGVAAGLFIVVPDVLLRDVQDLQPTFTSLAVMTALVIRPSTRTATRNFARQWLTTRSARGGVDSRGEVR